MWTRHVRQRGGRWVYGVGFRVEGGNARFRVESGNAGRWERPERAAFPTEHWLPWFLFLLQGQALHRMQLSMTLSQGVTHCWARCNKREIQANLVYSTVPRVLLTGEGVAGDAQVRSCTLDTWLPEQVAFMERTGNAVANAYREAKLHPSQRPAPDSPDLASFIRRKV